MQTAHHTALTAKHAILDRQIATEAQRPLPDATTLAAQEAEAQDQAGIGTDLE